MRFTAVLVLSFLYCVSSAQNIAVQISKAMNQMEADGQFRNAIISLYVIDSKTGKPVFERNAELGLAPASTQKVIISAAAFDLLGKDYRYKTDIGFKGIIIKDTLFGDLVIAPSGDPVFGSDRWPHTTKQKILQQITDSLKRFGIKLITGNMVINNAGWSTQATPRGWIWEDVGNYFGAGARAFNWEENEYDLILKPGKKEGDPVEIIKTEPVLPGVIFNNELTTGKPGSGDNSIIYLPELGTTAYVRGTVPAGKDQMVVRGSIPEPAKAFAAALQDNLGQAGIRFGGDVQYNNTPFRLTNICSFISPSFDSINYWFLRESVNLFGEAVVKTISFEKTGYGVTDTGISLIRDFWGKNGIYKSAIKIMDGSGLSPANRVTTDALVTVMQYAGKQSWFSSFYDALPVQNGIKMKSGYIGGVRSYTGYIKSKNGSEYTFAFIINNFDGNPGKVREKMWKLLDILK